MYKRKITGLMLAAAMVLQIAGCSGNKSNEEEEIKTFTSFFAVQGTPLKENNRVQKLIAEQTGAMCIETWLGEDQNADDVIGDMIFSNKYPDFIHGGTEQQKLLEANALIPIDEYWDEYERLRNYLTKEEWDRVREDDGHIYMIPQFSKKYGHDTDTLYVDEAFWLQVRVLEWAGYPEIITPEDYFDVIERYLEANPTMEDGTKNIGYEILSDGYMYFCLENPPQFLDGYPNDGCCMVNEKTMEAMDYNTTDTAKKWFKILNGAYKKGIIDQKFFLLKSDEYFEKMKSGAVLGMVDQYWNFGPQIDGLKDEYTYIPFDLVIDKNVVPRYRSPSQFDDSHGISISVDCDDIEGALKFLDDLLKPKNHRLRFWGEEGVDYEVGSDGIFYMTEEQQINSADVEYKLSNLCTYRYFPYYGGMDQDGINAVAPNKQPSEFYKKLSEPVKKCLSAYGVQTYADLINISDHNGAWFPMWSYTNTFTTDTTYGKVKDDMDKLKHEYLPKVVMSDDFDSEWKEYMDAYKSGIDIKVYLDELTAEIKRRSEKNT